MATKPAVLERPKPTPCSRCDGSGKEPLQVMRACAWCDGQGVRFDKPAPQE